MSDVEIRLLRRDDREQVTALVNAHAQAVVPGVTVSVNTVLRQLEREPGETIVDPWVRQRLALVAEQQGAVVAAAYLLRYGDGPDVGPGYRARGELRWLVCDVPSPSRPDPLRAGAALVAGAVTWLRRSGAQRISADGALPAPGVYGIPEQWPHVRDLLRAAGFGCGDRVEEVHLADLAALRRTPAPAPGLTLTRRLGVCGTRFVATDGPVEVGYIEVDVLASETGPATRQAGWADVGNLHVDPAWRRRGVATWLLGEAADWLRLGHVDRLLDYTAAGRPEESAYAAFLAHAGFRLLTRTEREWELDDSPAAAGRGGLAPC